MRPGRSMLAVLAGLAVLVASAQAAEPVTERVSVSGAEDEANEFSSGGAMSADGRFVTFSSTASNLVPGDTNGSLDPDAFVRDRQAGTTERDSLSSTGEQVAHGGVATDISADGRFVAFESVSGSLVAGDTNAVVDVFVRDRRDGVTERVSVNSAGEQATGGASFSGLLSADGRFVAFNSIANNLDPEDTGFFTRDVFVHDRQTGATELVTRGAVEGSVFGISGDGRFVGFTRLGGVGGTGVFVYDRQTGVAEEVAPGFDLAGQSSFGTGLSVDGRFVAFTSQLPLVPPDEPMSVDAFVHDRQTGTTERVSVNSAGAPANSDSASGSLSADGRFVGISSFATNLVDGDTNEAGDAFVRDRQEGTTVRVSVSSAGEQGNAASGTGDISADGSIVAFGSAASNLVADDTNGVADVFVRVLAAGLPPDTTAPEFAALPDIVVDATSPAGAVVSFTVTATDDQDADPAVSCDPASGSTFPVGTTTLTCTATDDAGNSAQASFAVTVRGAREQLRLLIAKVEASGLAAGTTTALTAPLREALRDAEAGDRLGACDALNAFVKHVRAQAGKKLSQELADALAADADRIGAVLACA